jgi:hypothetical protein
MSTIACLTCKARTQLVVVGEHRLPRWEDIPPRVHSFGHCAVCGEPGVTETTAGPYGTEEDEQLFPSPPRTLPKRLLPPRVEVSYREAVKCASAEAWLATAVMVRRTLEAIGQEFDPKAKPLFAGLKAMKEKGVISEELLQWGDHLRFLGNVSAHPTDEVVEPEDGARRWSSSRRSPRRSTSCDRSSRR